MGAMEQSNSKTIRTTLEYLNDLILKLNIKLQESRWYSIGIRIDINQWNRIKNPETDPQIYGKLIFYKGAKYSNLLI